MNKATTTLFLVLALAASQVLANTGTSVKCTKCKCYELKCSRLENPDSTCVNKYRDTCDNSEDISEGDFCNIQCDCCLENNCYQWKQYPCIMFRTYEFANIVYFILITVNAFILFRLYKSMFSKEKERIPDASDDENDALTKGKSGGPIQLKYAGRLRISKIDSEIEKVANSEQKEVIQEFFGDIQKKGQTYGCKNIATLGALVGLYMALNIFHIINIFFLGNLPLTYVYVAWLQHAMLVGFWVLVVCAFKKMKLYMDLVREIISQYQKEKNVVINLHEKGNLIDFTFKEGK